VQDVPPEEPDEECRVDSKPDPGDHTDIRRKIRKREVEIRPQDKVGGITDHRGSTPDIGRRNLRENERQRIDASDLPDLKGQGGHEKHDGDATHECREEPGEEREKDEEEERVQPHPSGAVQPQPTEETRQAHGLHHDHHAEHEDDGLPVLVPEELVRTEDESERQAGAQDGDNCPVDFLRNDQSVGENENPQGNPLLGCDSGLPVFDTASYWKHYSSTI